MSKARFLLVALICVSPAILLCDGLVTQGLVAGIVAVTLVMVALGLRPGETEFLVFNVRPALAMVAVPALWVLIQTLPLGVFAHPIWTSLATALNHRVTGAVSVDPAASVIALGQYISLTAIGLVSAAVAVDRQRAESVLFALTGGCAAIAAILLGQEWLHFGSGLGPLTHEQATACAGMGAIIAGATSVRTIERYETRRANPLRSVPTLLRTFAASNAALAICVLALVVAGTREVLAASGAGLTTFACVMIIRRFGAWYATAVAAPITCLIVLIVATPPTERARILLLTFAASPTAASERVLDDAPLMGTGAGTFAALARIYRETDDPPSRSVASTTAATFAIELGQPMLWFIAIVTAGFVVILLRASLRRGRDSFYPAMGASCLITLLLMAFVNAGLLASATGLIAAAALGLALVQSKSRTLAELPR